MLPEIPEKFYGKYKLATSENFDSFLKEIGKYTIFHHFVELLMIQTIMHFP